MSRTGDEPLPKLLRSLWPERLAAWLHSGKDNNPAPAATLATMHAVSTPPFDALVAIGPYNLPRGADPAAAVLAVETAVLGCPGADWASVEHHDVPLDPDAPWLDVLPAGSSRKPDGDEWRLLHNRIRQLILDTLAELPVTALITAAPMAKVDHAVLPPSPLLPALLVSGFAEGSTFTSLRPSTRQDTLGRHSPAPAPLSSPALPIERLLADDAASIPDDKMLATLLGFALPGDTMPLARRLMERFGSYARVLSAPQNELNEVRGIARHGLTAIKLTHAAALRHARATLMDQPVLEDWERLMEYLAAVLAHERIEQFRILFLNADHRLIADEAQARGTVNHTPVYPREVVRRALELEAAALILVHNHPSGDPTPSRDDLAMTKMICAAAKVMSVEIHDHVIVGNGRWFSFRKEELL